MTREDWSRAFLAGIGAPATSRNLYALGAWIQAEGGTASYNPLNSTKVVPDSTKYNWANVQNYPTYWVGVQANVDTLNYGADHGQYHYREIRRRLRANAWPRRTLHAVERSEWGTGGLALACLKWIKRDWKLYRNLPINE